MGEALSHIRPSHSPVEGGAAALPSAAEQVPVYLVQEYMPGGSLLPKLLDAMVGGLGSRSYSKGEQGRRQGNEGGRRDKEVQDGECWNGSAGLFHRLGKAVE